MVCAPEPHHCSSAIVHVQHPDLFSFHVSTANYKHNSRVSPDQRDKNNNQINYCDIDHTEIHAQKSKTCTAPYLNLINPDTDVVSNQNEAPSRDMATPDGLFEPRTKRLRDKRDRLTLIQLEPFDEGNLHGFFDMVLECQRNEIVVESLRRRCEDAETRLQQLEAEIDAIALRHLPDVEDEIERFQRIGPRLFELGEADLLAQWNTTLDANQELTRLRDQEEQVRQTSREYIDADVQRLIDDRLEIARIRAMRRLREYLLVNVGSTLPPRLNTASADDSNSDEEPPIAARDPVAMRYYEADYRLQKARLDHDGLRQRDGDRFAEWQTRQAETIDSDKRDAVWREIMATAIENLRRAESEWSEAAQEAYDHRIEANAHHTSIFSHSSYDTISARHLREAQEAKDAERAADPRISFRAAWNGEEMQWVERRPVCDWTQQLPAQESSVYNPIDVGTEAFLDGHNLWRPWGEHNAIQSAVDNVEGGSDSGLKPNMLPRLKRPIIGEGDDWGRQLKKHRKIAKYTAAMQERWRAFESTEPVFLPREDASISEFLDSDHNSTEAAPLSELEIDARGRNNPVDEGVLEPVGGETQSSPGPDSGLQDSPPAEDSTPRPDAPAAIRNGISKSELADMKTNTIITGSRSTRSGKNCNWPQLQKDEWARAQRARDGQ